MSNRLSWPDFPLPMLSSHRPVDNRSDGKINRSWLSWWGSRTRDRSDRLVRCKTLANSSETKVFISYARKDGSELPRKLYADLQNHGLGVWLDTRDLRGGATWTTEIERALDNCDGWGRKEAGKRLAAAAASEFQGELAQQHLSVHRSSLCLPDNTIRTSL